MPETTLLNLVLMLGGLAVAGLIVWRRFAGEGRRTKAFTALAAQRGFQYWPEDPYRDGPTASAVLGFGDGTVHHVVRGPHRGRHLQAFERRSGQTLLAPDPAKSERVVSIALPAPRPRLVMGPETEYTRRFERDLTFENQAFNDAFRVFSANPRFAHDVVHPRMMEWMLADPRARRYEWRFEGPWLSITEKGLLDAAQILPTADFLADVLDRVPEHVWTGE